MKTINNIEDFKAFVSRTDGHPTGQDKKDYQQMELVAEAARLAKAVKAYRKANGIRQQELADHLGVSRQTIINVERCRTTPSARVFLLLKELVRM